MNTTQDGRDVDRRTTTLRDLSGLLLSFRLDTTLLDGRAPRREQFRGCRYTIATTAAGARG